jgi:hypothetical protein
MSRGRLQANLVVFASDLGRYLLYRLCSSPHVAGYVLLAEQARCNSVLSHTVFVAEAYLPCPKFHGSVIFRWSTCRR